LFIFVASLIEAVRFRVLSWNVLADGLANDQFKDRAELVKWPSRAPLFLQEIARCQPDIAMLVEVNHFDKFWRPQMAELGYDGFVRKEKGYSPCTRYFPRKTKDIKDGCAIFYRKEQYDKLQDLSFAFEDGKCAAAALLREKQHGRPIIVAVTHLKSGGDDQAPARVQEMEALLDHLGQHMDQHEIPPALVVGGDWNDPIKGPVETLVQHSAIATQVGLMSAYSAHPPAYTAQELSATWNFEHIEGVPNGGYMDSIDYIYFSTATLKVSQVLAEPSFQDVLKVDDGAPLGIPNRAYPSDHIALACDLLWT